MSVRSIVFTTAPIQPNWCLCRRNYVTTVVLAISYSYTNQFQTGSSVAYPFWSPSAKNHYVSSHCLESLWCPKDFPDPLFPIKTKKGQVTPSHLRLGKVNIVGPDGQFQFFSCSNNFRWNICYLHSSFFLAKSWLTEKLHVLKMDSGEFSTYSVIYTEDTRSIGQLLNGILLFRSRLEEHLWLSLTITNWPRFWVKVDISSPLKKE